MINGTNVAGLNVRPGETPITLFEPLKLGALCCSGALGCSLVSLVVNPALIRLCTVNKAVGLGLYQK